MSKYADDDNDVGKDDERSRTKAWATVQRYSDMKKVYAYIKEHDLPEPDDETKYLQVTPENYQELAARFGVEVEELPDDLNFYLQRKDRGTDFLVKRVDLETADEETKAQIESKRALLPPD